MIGLAFGLIHLWIAAAALTATAWQDWRQRAISQRWLLRLALPAAGGVVAVVALVYFTVGWNMPATLVAVTRRFGQIQRELALSKTIWFFIGVPLFLLFVSPGLAAFAALGARRPFRKGISDKYAFGLRLTVATLAFMALSYITGVTYELPRLWVAFLPTLTLGVMVASPLALARHGKAMRALLFILAAQLIITAAHWIQLDVRESEYRLTHQRFFTALPAPGTTIAQHP
jgi:hypothetical protein